MHLTTLLVNVLSCKAPSLGVSNEVVFQGPLVFNMDLGPTFQVFRLYISPLGLVASIVPSINSEGPHLRTKDYKYRKSGSLIFSYGDLEHDHLTCTWNPKQ